MMNYELEQLKEALKERDIEYMEEDIPFSDEKYIRVANGYCNYIRVSFDRGDIGYYVRHSGCIYEDLTLEEVLVLAEEVVT